MSDENSQEVAKLLDLKREYRSEVAKLEVTQRMQMAAELAAKKQGLAEKYADQLATKITEKVVASLKPMLTEVFRDE